MKKLKLFESFRKENSKHHVQLVIDIFQDIFDDYGIERWQYTLPPTLYGKYYNITHIEPRYIRLTIFYTNKSESGDGPGIELSDFKNDDVKLIDFGSPIERLESIGYDVRKKWHYDEDDELYLEILINYSNI